MRDVLIQDYIGKKKELTAEQVRKLPVGTQVLLHHFDRSGEHVLLETTVAKSGNKKILLARDWKGNRIVKTIRKECGRFCYTEA